MEAGSVIRFTNVEHRPDPGLRLGYKAGRKEQYVAVLRGLEPRDGSDDLDVEAVLNRLGWKRDEEKTDD